MSHSPPVDEDSLEEHVECVRLGHGANCSSVGSVVDTLFATAAVGTALFAAIAAALKSEAVHVVGAPEGTARPPKEEEDPP